MSGRTAAVLAMLAASLLFGLPAGLLDGAWWVLMIYLLSTAVWSAVFWALDKSTS